MNYKLRILQISFYKIYDLFSIIHCKPVPSNTQKNLELALQVLSDSLGIILTFLS